MGRYQGGFLVLVRSSLHMQGIQGMKICMGNLPEFQLPEAHKLHFNFRVSSA